MSTETVDIEALKNDPEFLENLKTLEAEMKEESSIAKGYQLLDAKLAIEAGSDEIDEVFTFIVNSAFDRLSESIASAKNFDVTQVEDRATARAVYEYALQCFSEEDRKSAKEMFLALHSLLEHDELKEAMMIHACVVMAGYGFEDFIENLVDTEGVDPSDPLAFFVTTFTQPNDILLTMYAKYVAEAEEQLAKLKEYQANAK